MSQQGLNRHGVDESGDVAVADQRRVTLHHRLQREAAIVAVGNSIDRGVDAEILIL